MKLVRHVSFVDCPGHDILMATMLNGAAVMDAALLLIAGNETCPQPQTSEHLAAVEIMKLENIIILQNKVDLIKESQALEHQKSIAAFVKGEPFFSLISLYPSSVFWATGTVAESSPIVPISAQLKYNIDAVNEYIVKRIPIPVRNFTADPKLIVIRSFDVNKPGAEVDELKGGVAGGSILTGTLRLGMEVEIRPGIVTKDAQGRNKCKPIFSRIVSLHAESNHLQFAVPGGLIGVGTRIDPTLCRADRLVGQVLGAVGKLPQIYSGKSAKRTSTLTLTDYCRACVPVCRIGDQSVLAPSSARCQDGGQETDEGVEARQGRVAAHQHWLHIDRWACAKREGGSGQDPADVACMYRGRREGRPVAPYREALAACR